MSYISYNKLYICLIINYIYILLIYTEYIIRYWLLVNLIICCLQTGDSGKTVM